MTREQMQANLTLHGWEPGQYAGGLCIVQGNIVLYLGRDLVVKATTLGALPVFPDHDERARWSRMADNAFWALATTAQRNWGLP